MGKSLDDTDQQVFSRVTAALADNSVVDVYGVAKLIAADIADRSLADITRDVEKLVVAAGGSAIWTKRPPELDPPTLESDQQHPEDPDKLRHARAQ